MERQSYVDLYPFSFVKENNHADFTYAQFISFQNQVYPSNDWVI